jgi:hypothetical protein
MKFLVFSSSLLGSATISTVSGTLFLGSICVGSGCCSGAVCFSSGYTGAGAGAGSTSEGYFVSFMGWAVTGAGSGC